MGEEILRLSPPQQDADLSVGDGREGQGQGEKIGLKREKVGKTVKKPNGRKFLKQPVALRCRRAMLGLMDWQQVTALGIVGVTAGLFLRAKLRRKAFSFARDTHCGCSAPSGTSARGSIVFSARKGQRPVIRVKEN
jgi:hypothetical protein